MVTVVVLDHFVVPRLTMFVDIHRTFGSVPSLEFCRKEEGTSRSSSEDTLYKVSKGLSVFKDGIDLGLRFYELRDPR